MATGRLELLIRTPVIMSAYDDAVAKSRPVYRSTADSIRHRFFHGRPYYVSDSDQRLCCDGKDIEKPLVTDELEQLSRHSRICPASASSTSIHDSVCVHFITRKSITTTTTTAPSSSPSESKVVSSSSTNSVAKVVWTLNEYPYALEAGGYHSLLWYIE